MPRGVHRAPHLVDAAGAAGRGLVVHDADRLDAVRLVVGERGADRRHVGAAAPVGVDEDRLEVEPLRHLVPQRGEPAGAAHQHRIARRQGVGQRRFPRAGAGRGIDHHRPLGLEDRPQVGEDLHPQPAEIGTAMVDRRAVDGAQHPVRHVGGAGDLQEMPAGVVLRHGASWRGAHRVALIPVVANEAVGALRGNRMNVQRSERSDCPQERIPTRRTSEGHGRTTEKGLNALYASIVDLGGPLWLSIVVRTTRAERG